MTKIMAIIIITIVSRIQIFIFMEPFLDLLVLDLVFFFGPNSNELSFELRTREVPPTFLSA